LYGIIFSRTPHTYKKVDDYMTVSVTCSPMQLQRSLAELLQKSGENLGFSRSF